MLLEWFWRSPSERKGDPKVGFSFPGGSLQDGRCFVELVLIFPVRWPRGGLGSTACRCLSRDDVGRRTAARAWGLSGGFVESQPGFFWQIPWRWSSLNKAPLFRPPSSFCADGRGRDQIPAERGGSSSTSPDRDPPRQTPLGDQPAEGLGCLATTGLSPASPPGKPKRVQDFPPKIDLSFSVFFLFLPLSLLAVTLSPLCRLCPAGGFAGNPRSLHWLPPSKCQILAGLCFPEMKRCRMLP